MEIASTKSELDRLQWAAYEMITRTMGTIPTKLLLTFSDQLQLVTVAEVAVLAAAYHQLGPNPITPPAKFFN